MNGIQEVCRFLYLTSSNQTTYLHKYVLPGEQKIAMPKTNKKYFFRTFEPGMNINVIGLDRSLSHELLLGLSIVAVSVEVN